MGLDTSTGTVLLFLLLFTGWMSCESGRQECVVPLRIDAGWVCGALRPAEDGTPYASFRGVPYAKPPVGDRRFKELEPPEPWEHMYDATEDRAACPQKDFIYSRLPLQLKGQNEDCMHLNLHLPITAYSQRLRPGPQQQRPRNGVPIIVMVHGGGFQAGSGLTDMHGPEYLLRKDVIVITFNHRISIFGYLSLNTAKIPGNQALRDVITLLRWVQRNARAFGGNPDDVTLVGHSTGASCAHLVSLSKPARGLIHKVVIMSGTAVPNYFSPSRAHAKSVADKFLAALGINSTDPDYIHGRLTKEPIVNLIYALNLVQLKADLLDLNFVPTVEEEFPNVTRVVDDDPLALMARGRGREYPLMIGFNTAEFNYFRLQLLGSDIMERVDTQPSILLPARIRENKSEKEQIRLANEFKKRYFKNGATFEQVVLHFSDMYFVHPALVVARWRARWGAPAYLYQFAYEAERNIIKEANWCQYDGVAHVEDLTYLFRMNAILQQYVAYPLQAPDDYIKDWFSSFFINFAICGNPTCTLPETQWPPVVPAPLQYQDVSRPAHLMSNLTAYQQDLMDFYDRVDEELRNIEDEIKRNSVSIIS